MAQDPPLCSHVHSKYRGISLFGLTKYLNIFTRSRFHLVKNLLRVTFYRWPSSWSALIREISPSPFLLLCHNGFPYFSFNSFTNFAQCDCLHRWPSSWSQLGHSFLLLTSFLSVQCWDSPSSSIVAPQQLLHTTQLVFDRVSSGANWARFLDSITHCSELGKMIKAFLQWELFGKLTLQGALWALL